jgi:hypothetical protein
MAVEHFKDRSQKPQAISIRVEVTLTIVTPRWAIDLIRLRDGQDVA